MRLKSRSQLAILQGGNLVFRHRWLTKYLGKHAAHIFFNYVDNT